MNISNHLLGKTKYISIETSHIGWYSCIRIIFSLHKHSSNMNLSKLNRSDEKFNVWKLSINIALYLTF